MEAQAVAVLVQPGPQPGPGPAHRFVGDLDGVLVGDHQPAGDEGVEHRLGGGVDGEVGAGDPLTDRVAGLGRDHQPQEQVAGRLAARPATASRSTSSAARATAPWTPPTAR